MGFIFWGKTRCPLCKVILAEDDETIGFTAFIPNTHALARFSDCVMHRNCFEIDPQSKLVVYHYARYKKIFDSRPLGLKTMAEIDAWGINAFKGFWDE
jgi:hypothetical protein